MPIDAIVEEKRQCRERKATKETFDGQRDNKEEFAILDDDDDDKNGGMGWGQERKGRKLPEEIKF